MKKIFLIIFLWGIILNSETFEITSTQMFVEKMKIATKEDVFELRVDINIGRLELTNNEKYFKLKGTINGNGRTLSVSSVPISLSDDTVINDTNLTGIPSGELNAAAFNGEVPVNNPIYMNGYNLTLNNVESNLENGANNKQEVKPIIILGTSKVINENGHDEGNTLKITGEKKLELRGIVAGGHGISKNTKSTIDISSDKVRLKNENTSKKDSKIFLGDIDNLEEGNINTTGKKEIVIKNSSKDVNIFEGNSENTELTFENIVITRKKYEIPSNLKKLNLKNSTIIINKDLTIDNVNLEGKSLIEVEQKQGIDEDGLPEFSASNLYIKNLKSEEVSMIKFKGSNLKIDAISGGLKYEKDNRSNLETPEGTVTSGNTLRSGEVEENSEKERLNNLIESKMNLSQNQKNSLKEEVRNQNENLTELETKINELDNKMQNLKEAVTALETIKSNPDYSKLDESLKQNIENLLTSNAKDSVTTIDKDVINSNIENINNKKTEALQKIEELKTLKKNEVKEYLNTLIFLEEANKQDLISKIESAENINKLEEIKQEAILKNTQDENAYKEQVKNALEKTDLVQEQISKLEKEISDGTTKENIEAVKEKAKQLNVAMRELRSEKDKLLQLKSSSNYSNEFNESIDALVSDTQNITKIETVSLISSLKEKIKEKIKEVNNKINEKTTLDEKKAEKKRELSELTNLEQEQKNQFITKIENANLESELEEIKREFDELNSLMESLKEKKQTLDNIKNNEKYNDENFNSGIKEEIDKLETKYSEVSNQIDKNSITELTTKYTTKNEEVNTEITRVTELKEAISEIESYTNINQEEKEKYKNLVKQATNIEGIEAKKLEAKTRDDKKGELNTLIEGKEELSSSQKITLKEEVKNSNDANLEIFNTKISELAEEMRNLNNARAELEKVKSNLNYEKLEQNLKTSVDNLIDSSNKEQINSVNKNDITSKKEELINKKTEVLEKIKDLKTSKKLEVSNLTGLTQEQKNKFNSEIEELENLPEIEEVVNKARELDTEMLKLIPLKLKLETLKVDEKLSEKDKNKVNEELAKYNNNLEKDKVQELINSFKPVIDLMELKIETKKQIESLSKLNDMQKNDLKSKVDEADNQEKINELKNSFVELTNSITSLKESLEILKSLKNEENKEEIERLERESESKISKQDIDAHKILVEQKIKEILRNNVKSYINNLSDLTKEQKEKLIQKITDDSTYEDVKVEAISLNESMKKLNELKNKLAGLKVNEKVAELLNEIDEVGKDINKSDIDKLIEKIKKEISIDLTKYIDYVKAFTYNDINVTKSFDEKTYFNFHLGKGNINSLDTIGLIGGVNTGFNIEVAKGIKVGAFAEYEKDLSHQISLGTNFKHKDGLAFIRYRLGIYDKLINHNIDLYGKYNKEIKVLKDLTITPSIGIYLSYSSKVEIDEYVRLNQRFIALGDLEAKINYNLYGIDLYATPLIKFGYNGAVLVNKINEEETLNAGVDYVIYGVNAGIKKSFLNGIVLKFDLGANANEKLDFKLKTDLGIGYNW